MKTFGDILEDFQLWWENYIVPLGLYRDLKAVSNVTWFRVTSVLHIVCPEVERRMEWSGVEWIIRDHFPSHLTDHLLGTHHCDGHLGTGDRLPGYTQSHQRMDLRRGDSHRAV